jgi:Mrp family chromosome partitioning ATPase
MSRIAEAYRKSGRGPFAERAPSAEASASSNAGITELPWDLEDSRTHVAEGPRPITQATHSDAPSGVASITSAPTGDAGALREQILPVVQRILKGDASGRPIRSVVFTAISTPSSALVCGATGDALAHKNAGSVCVVDGNLRSPGLQSFFDVTAAAGLSDLLLDGGDLRTRLTRLTTDLWLLPAGARRAEAVPLLAAGQMHRCVMQLLDMFDYVLIDMFPITGPNDMASLGADSVVLVVAANVTRRQVAKRVAEHLHGVNVNILGAVLTNRVFAIPEAIYRRL